MKIVITGGLGYVGSAVCELYRNESQHEVLVIDRDFNAERIAGYPEHFRFVQADVTEVDLMKRLLENADVLHLLSAEVEAEQSIHKEAAVWENNFDAPKNLISQTPDATRIMFPSTGNVFGGADPNEKWSDLTEEDEPSPKYPYAETKRAMENYLSDSGRNFTVVRFGTNHGYSPGIRFNLVTNNFARRAMLGQTLTIHGNGENHRPTVCVKDCARALLFLSGRDDVAGETYHVVQESLQIRELASRVARVFDAGAQVSHIAKEVPFNSYALNSDKLQNLGFEFKWNLESSVADMGKQLKAMRPNAE